MSEIKLEPDKHPIGTLVYLRHGDDAYECFRVTKHTDDGKYMLGLIYKNLSAEFVDKFSHDDLVAVGNNAYAIGTLVQFRTPKPDSKYGKRIYTVIGIDSRKWHKLSYTNQGRILKFDSWFPYCDLMSAEIKSHPIGTVVYIKNDGENAEPCEVTDIDHKGGHELTPLDIYNCSLYPGYFDYEELTIRDVKKRKVGI